MFNIESKTRKMTLEQNPKLFLFPKGLTHGFCEKFEISYQFFFFEKVLDKLFDYILHRIQGLTADFDQNFEIFSHFLKKFAQKYSLVVFQIENKAFQTTKMTLEQSRKIAFILKGLTSVSDKNLKFLLTLFFFF